MSNGEKLTQSFPWEGNLKRLSTIKMEILSLRNAISKNLFLNGVEAFFKILKIRSGINI